LMAWKLMMDVRRLARIELEAEVGAGLETDMSFVSSFAP
jgi:hypothetical protein